MWFILPVAAIVGYSLLKQGVGATRLLVNPAGYGFDFSKGELTINMQFTNPTTQKYDVQYIFLDALIEGNLIGQVRQQSAETLFTIEPNSDNFFTVRFKPSLMGIVTQLYTMALTGKRPPAMLLKGEVRANGIAIPIQKEIAYSTPKAPAA
jgi:hypothetical protein